jgi:hypothetical protein
MSMRLRTFNNEIKNKNNFIRCLFDLRLGTGQRLHLIVPSHGVAGCCPRAPRQLHVWMWAGALRRST